MNKTTIYLVRHGQTEWNVEHRFQGHQDSPLTELGLKQARWLGEALLEQPLDWIYSSSSPRAIKTAELIRGSRPIAITECDEMKEINLGEWEGQVAAEIAERCPEAYEHFWRQPDRFRAAQAETFAEVERRALGKLRHILQGHAGQTVLIVTHTVVVKLLMAAFEQRPIEQLWELPYIHPACLCKIEFTEDGKPDIKLHGDISHYQEAIHPVEG